MFWYWEDYHPPHPHERILPAGMMEITINLSNAPFRIHDQQTQVINDLMVAGGRSRAFIIDTTYPMSILSVWFKPGGAWLFFDVPGNELHNLHLPLETLWGLKARELYEQLCEASSTSDRFHILERVLMARLCRAKKDRHKAVNHALQIFSIAPHITTIKQVVDDIALSSTRFIQIFREDVGMTPKRFCRVQRFQHALDMIATQQNIHWADIALACGYYDQSHFINEFHSLSGITPSAYAPQSREHNTNLPVYDLS